MSTIVSTSCPDSIGRTATFRHRLLVRIAIGVAAAAGLLMAGTAYVANALGQPWRVVAQHPQRSWILLHGENPAPMQLRLPAVKPLSAMAQLGRALYVDASLSASGKMSCASCHDPANGYNPPPGSGPVMFGGPRLDTAGMRPPPSLAYLYRQQPFSIGPDNEQNETTTLQQLVQASKGASRATKTAADTQTTARNLVPQGGMFWDGRASTLQAQADGPLFNPAEMDAGSPQRVAAILADGPLAPQFRALFGATIFTNPQQLVSEALFAIARYQVEDPSFHAFTSKYDAWLQGKARLTPQEMRGYLAFNDPRRGDCAACHLAKPTRDGLPPLFTDAQYEALGVPRNPAIPANRDPAFHDLGLCGPVRQDLHDQRQYCGMFLTPTLRNVARRPVYFHNGVYHDLEQVLDFYDFRDVQPGKVYPVGADGKVQKFNDLPAADRANVDTVDPPFDRHAGERPAMSARDMRDIIAFLHTLNDGWQGAH